jgi:voltage-gated potassium channel
MKHPVRHILKAIIYWDYALLVLVFFLIFVIPVFPARIHSELYNIFITLIYIFAAMAVGREKRYYVALALTLIILEWLSSILELSLINQFSKALSIIFFILIVINFIRQVARAKHVDARVILDAVNGYLLLAIVFSILVTLIMHFNPQAYNFPASDAVEPEVNQVFTDHMYYTLVTITTLGYGDMVPVATYAKSLATLISVSGQFYVAILIAMLVGKYASQRAKTRDEKN